MDAIVRTSNLRKSYGTREVLHGVDLCVPAGSIYGFLGPNGAGKTTTIRILMGLLQRSGGSAEVFGRDVWRDGPVIRRDVGYLPGDIRWYDRMTGRATLAFLGSARGNGDAAEIDRLAKRFDLDLGRRVRGYSRGMKQKLGLIQALMHKPRLLILDEPTASLDPLVCEAVHDELRRAARDGSSVLFSSHTLGEVQQLCDWVGVVRDGVIIEQQRIEALRERALRRVDITLADGDAQPVDLPEGLHVGHRDGNRLVGSWTGPTHGLIRWLDAIQPADVTIEAPNLEDLFLAYYSDRNAESAA